jgi:hypothetical protein
MTVTNLTLAKLLTYIYDELHNLYHSPSIIRMIKSRRMRWSGNVARMGRRGIHIGYWWERQKISLFVASCYSQGYGGGIRHRLHMGVAGLYQFSTELFFTTTLHGPNTQHRSQKSLYCCLRIRCRGNLCTEPLPSNGLSFGSPLLAFRRHGK